MLKQFNHQSKMGIDSILGNAMPSKERIDRIMGLIDEEPLYSHPTNPQHIELVNHKAQKTPPKQGVRSNYFSTKKIIIAAALMIALLITPFNGTTFAGEILNWTNQLAISRGVDFLEGRSSLLPITQEVHYNETHFSTLEEVILQLQADAFDITALPMGYAFEKATRYSIDDSKDFFLHVNFSDTQGKKYHLEYIYSEHIRSKDQIGQLVTRIEGHNLKYAEVSFFDTQALVAKRPHYYSVHPYPITTVTGDLEISKHLALHYTIEGHDPEWEQGLKFLEHWYSSVQTQQ